MLWAKSTGVPLVRHMGDVTIVAGLLWDEWLPPHAKRIISSSFKTRTAARRFAMFIAGVHDIGKATPSFQSMDPALFANGDPALQKLLYSTQLTDEEKRQSYHTTTGHSVLTRLLRERKVPKDQTRALSALIALHHGFPMLDADVARMKETLGEYWVTGDNPEEWERIQTEAFDDLLEETGFKLSAIPRKPLPVSAQVMLVGLTIVADWIASGYVSAPGKYDPAVKARAALDAIELPKPWTPVRPPKHPAKFYTERFAEPGSFFKPHYIQTAALEAVDGMSSPGLLIIEEAMGGGKTEAGLVAAEALAYRFGMSGVYVALPTMATSDRIFDRTRNWVERIDTVTRASGTMFLAHGRSTLHEGYRELLNGGGKKARAVTHPFITRQRRLGLLSNFVVGTIDQLLMTALNSKYLALRHMAFASKVVVIDEVHAYDAYMNVYLVRALQWLGYYGVPVVMLSATLDSRSRQQLVNAYRTGRRVGKHVLADKHEAVWEAAYQDEAEDEGWFSPKIYGNLDALMYPRITLSTDHLVRSTQVDPSARSSSIQVELTGGNAGEQGELEEYRALAVTLRSALADGGSACIIRNTVHRSQETYKVMKAEFPDAEVILLHSQFIGLHRQHRESELNRMFGKDSTPTGQRPKRAIVVGTQVLEQSLDVDFDIMVSDLAPMDLLLQRVGRVHRHASTVRPERLAYPRFLIAGTFSNNITGAKALGINSAVSAVYGEWPLHRALVCIREITVNQNRILELPRDIPRLTEAAYGGELAAPESWKKTIDKAHALWKRNVEELQKRANSRFRLQRPPAPDGYTDLIGWSGERAAETSDDGEHTSPAVRDIEDQLEVLLLEKTPHGTPVPWRIFDGNYPGALSLVDPDREMKHDPLAATAAASSMIRLPMKLSGKLIDDAKNIHEPESWKHNEFLRFKKVLALNPGVNRLCGFNVRYTEETGLEVWTETDE